MRSGGVDLSRRGNKLSEMRHQKIGFVFSRFTSAEFMSCIMSNCPGSIPRPAAEGGRVRSQPPRAGGLQNRVKTLRCN